MYKRAPGRWGAVCVLLALITASSAASAGTRTVVLNNKSQMRTFMVMKTPVLIGADGKLKPAVIQYRRGKPKAVPKFESPMPASNWRSPQFDDSSWKKSRAPVEAARGSATGGKRTAMHSATKSAMICSRSYFRVDNPGAVRDLRISLEYVGGAIVFVNGVEVTRQHLPKGELKADALATKYPGDLYVEPGNNYLQHAKINPKGFARRYRKISDLVIPAKLLKKGANVLALQLHRAPVNEAATNVKIKPHSGMRRVVGLWAYVGLGKVELSAATGSSVIANVGRPRGVQVWPCELTETITSFSYGNPAAPERPVSVVAARNGTFVGRFVISSGSEIQGLKVSAPELVHADGKTRLSGEALQVRHARAAKPGESWLASCRFDGLLPGVPSTVPVTKVSSRDRAGGGATAGATVPVWLGVRVPADAKPGMYKGLVKISARGLAEKKLPLEVEVFGWKAPSPQNFMMRQTNIFSPDTMVLYYKVPYWSDKHMELMGKSMELMSQLGARQVIAHLAMYTHSRDEHNCRDGLIRWVSKADGSFEYDFTAFDKFLDLIAKTVGKPRPLRLSFWGEDRNQDSKWDRPCPVPLLDRATGTISRLPQPPAGSEESYKFWKPVLDEVRKRVEKRGWWDVTTVAHCSYASPPNPKIVDVTHKIWPDARWSYTAHNGRHGSSWRGSGKTRAPIDYSTCVWTEGTLRPRGYKDLFKPERKKGTWNTVRRSQYLDWNWKTNPAASGLRCYHRLPEEVIMRGHNGLGSMTADLFPLENPKRKGRYYRITINAGGVAGWSAKSFLSPGKDGAVATERYEVFRAAVQECEAVLYLQKSLETSKISGDLAKRVNDYLQMRGEAFTKGLDAGRDGNRVLLGLAAEVAKATGK